MNKKGLAPQFMILIVLGLIFIVMMILYFGYSLIAPPLTSSINIGIVSLETATQGQGNLTMATESSFGIINESLDNLKWITYTLMIVMFLMFILVCSFVRTYPFLIPFWILIVIVIAFLSILLSSSYSNIALQGGAVGEAYRSYTINNYFMQYLPHIIVVFGIVSGLVLLVIVSKDNQAEVVI